MGISLYAGLPLLVAIVSPGLGLYVLARNPYLREGRALFLTMALYGVLGLSYFALANAPDGGAALLSGSLAMAVTILAFGSMWYLTSFLPYSRGRSWPAEHPLPFWIALIIMAITCGIMVDAVTLTDIGYGLSMTSSVLMGDMVCILLAIGTATTVLRVWWESHEASFRRECILLALMPIISFSPLTVFFGPDVLPILSLAFLASGMIYFVLVLKHNVFTITMTSCLPWRKPPIEPGDAILLKGRDLRPAYGIFISEIRSGASGLVVCRTHPDRIREEMEAPDVATLWLSALPGPDRIDPSSLNILNHSISGFIFKGVPVVILLEGLEYLIAENSLRKVLQMLYSIRDAVTITGSKLIIPIDPMALRAQELALLEKEFPVQMLAGS